MAILPRQKNILSYSKLKNNSEIRIIFEMNFQNCSDLIKSLIKTSSRKNDYGTVNTYTVVSVDKDGKINKRGTDDMTYHLYPELIDLVPRGCSDFVWSDGGVETLRGLPKFSGTTPTDEEADGETGEEEDQTVRYFSLEDLKSWGDDLVVEFQKKENGKFLIFRILWKNGAPYLFGGSKNVHVVHPLDAPIVNKKELHYRMMAVVQADLADKNDQWLKTHVGDRAIIGEYVDGQHIVWVDVPYVVCFNLPIKTVEQVLPSQKYLPTPEQLHHLRTLQNIEGVVIVYRNEKTGQVFRHKHKTVWYILLRVMREALCHSSKDKGFDFLHSRVVGRFEQRSEDFLNLTDTEKKDWRELSGKFISWLLGSRYQLCDLGFTSAIGMARVWKAFTNGEEIVEEKDFEEKKDLDIIDLVEDMEPVTLLFSLVQKGIKSTAVLRGPSGSGKSTLAALLAKTVDASIHSTDNFFMKNGRYEFAVNKLKENHEKNLAEFLNSDKMLAVVDNTNLAAWEYDKYRQTDRVLVVVNMKTRSPDVLAQRTRHGVPLDKIVQMHAKSLLPIFPMFYGVFFERSICPTAKQRTPLHMTCLYVGGKKELDRPEMRKFFGMEVKVVVTSEATNIAGRKYYVELPFGIPYANEAVPHITLETNGKYTAADVGKLLDTTVVARSETFVGIFGACY